MHYNDTACGDCSGVQEYTRSVLQWNNVAPVWGEVNLKGGEEKTVS